MNKKRASVFTLLTFLTIILLSMTFQPVAAADISTDSELGETIEAADEHQNTNKKTKEYSSSSATSSSSVTDDAEITVQTGRVTANDGTRNVKIVAGVTNTSSRIPEAVSGVNLSINVTAPDRSTETYSRTTNTNGITTIEYEPTRDGEHRIEVDSPEVSDTGYDSVAAGPTMSFFPGWHDVVEVDRNVTVGVGILDAGSPVSTDQQTVDISTPSGNEITKNITTDQTGTATFNFTPEESGKYLIKGDRIQSSLTLKAADVTGKVQFNTPFADYLKSKQTAGVYGQLKDEGKPYANEEINVSIKHQQNDSIVYSEVTDTDDRGLFLINWTTPSTDLYYDIDVSSTSDKSIAVHGTGIDVNTVNDGDDDDDSSSPSATDLTINFDEKDYSPTFKPGEQATATIRVTNDSEPVPNAPINYRGRVGYPGAIIASGNTTTNSTGHATVTFTVPEGVPLTDDFEFNVYASVDDSTFEESEYGDINDIKWEQDNDYSASPQETINYSTTATEISTGDPVSDVPTQVFLESNAFHASVISADLAETDSDGTDNIQFTAPNKTGELFFGDWGPYRSPNTFRSLDSEVYDVNIDSNEEYSQGETATISYSADTDMDVSATVLIAAGDNDYEQINSEAGLLYAGQISSGEKISFTVPESVPTGSDYWITVSSSTLDGSRTVETDEFEVTQGDDSADDDKFLVENITAPSSVVQGENITISATINNTADKKLTQNITSNVSYRSDSGGSAGAGRLLESLTLDARSQQQVNFTITVPSDAVSFSAGISSANDTAVVSPTVRTNQNAAAPFLGVPEDGNYDPGYPLTIGTAHNATGVISSGDVAIRFNNVTASNNTTIALNESNAIPLEGDVNTTIPASELSGDVMIEAQLLNATSKNILVTNRFNLTANTSNQLASQIDSDNDNRIGDFEILKAIDYWRTNQTVPNTNQMISDQDILTLIDMWQEETEVAA